MFDMVGESPRAIKIDGKKNAANENYNVKMVSMVYQLNETIMEGPMARRL